MPTSASCPPSCDVFESRAEHAHVVAVGPLHRPADRDADRIGGDRTTSIRAWPGPRGSCPFLSRSSWGFVHRPVDGHLAHVETDDLVVATDCLVGDGVEDSGTDPLVASFPSGGVRDHPCRQVLGVLPRTARDETDKHHLETGPVRLDAATVATPGGGPHSGPGPGARWPPRGSIYHFVGLNAGAIDEKYLALGRW